MDRQEWLAERQAAVVTVYDAEAPAYDEHDYPSDVQREWVARALALIPPGGIVLDVPCGTGKYLPVVAADVDADRHPHHLLDVDEAVQRQGADGHRCAWSTADCRDWM